MSNTPTENAPPKLLDQVVARIRVKHCSRRTEQAYVDWIKRYICHHGKSHPKDMGASEVGPRYKGGQISAHAAINTAIYQAWATSCPRYKMH